MKIISRLKSRWKIILAAALLTAAVLVFLPLLVYEPIELPPGTNVSSPLISIAPEDTRLLIDDTAWDAQAGRRVIDQEIFDEILAMIDRADQFIFLDLFLWNPWQGSIPEDHRRMSEELADAIIRKKRSIRNLDVIVLTDPINRIYGGHEPDFFKRMAKVGVPVVFTDLSRLPDSNSAYAPYWSITEKILNFPILSQWASRPRISNPFQQGGREISVFQMGRMLLFKANHRKVVVTGSSKYGLEMLVGSLNPADGSSAHSNLALTLKGRPVLNALETELAALGWTIERKRNVIVGATSMAAFKAESILRKARRINSSVENDTGGPSIKWLTEGAIAEEIIRIFEGSGEGDKARIAIFYMSDRRIIKALKKAVSRGLSVRIVMDANRDAFGMKKIGVPNRPVAAEIMDLSAQGDIEIRWADTHGEQFHTKAVSLEYGKTGRKVFMAGSANWTRRNIGNLNMEANLLVNNAHGITDEFNAYFDRIWDNSDGLSHTLPYAAWEEKGLKGFFKTITYRFQERFGMGTF